MAKTISEMPLAGLIIDQKSDQPMYRQLYDYFRESILDGRLRPGQRLPATRQLAKELGVSRNTVMLAFDDLLSEGYLEGRAGSGTFITGTLPENMTHAQQPEAARQKKLHSSRQFSQRGEMMVSTSICDMNCAADIRPFQHGVPALPEFPYEIWARIAARQLRSTSLISLGYNEPAGYRPLREAIAGYLRTSRAVRCEADQIIMVNGVQQAMDLIARLLLDPGDIAWVEDPGYVGTNRALANAGAQLVPVPIDEEGLDVAYGRKKANDARLVYVTPSHQYPLGVTMSVCRRLELLSWADEADAWIVEDDYDSEYRYCGRPLSSLQGLDVGDRVIYLGTFSKVLFPSLRLGYIVVPEHLVDGFQTARTVVDRHAPVFEQMVLANFIEEGHFARHIRRMRMLYEERQNFLKDAIAAELGGLMRASAADAGMHLVGWLPEQFDDRQVAALARQNGLIVNSVSNYSLEHYHKPGLVMGYSAYDEKAIRQGIRTLGKVLRES